MGIYAIIADEFFEQKLVANIHGRDKKIKLAKRKETNKLRLAKRKALNRRKKAIRAIKLSYPKIQADYVWFETRIPDIFRP